MRRRVALTPRLGRVPNDRSGPRPAAISQDETPPTRTARQISTRSAARAGSSARTATSSHAHSAGSCSNDRASRGRGESWVRVEALMELDRNRVIRDTLGVIRRIHKANRVSQQQPLPGTSQSRAGVRPVTCRSVSCRSPDRCLTDRLHDGSRRPAATRGTPDRSRSNSMSTNPESCSNVFTASR